MRAPPEALAAASVTYDAEFSDIPGSARSGARMRPSSVPGQENPLISSVDALANISLIVREPNETTR